MIFYVSRKESSPKSSGMGGSCERIFDKAVDRMKMGQRISTDGTVENPVNAIDNMPVYRYTKSRGDQYGAE